MKALYIYTLCVLLSLPARPAKAQQYRIFINPTSSVTVYGSTNISQFRFRYTEVISIEKPVTVITRSDQLKLEDCIIDLKIRAFDSGNPLMNRDFRQMLNEEENPCIQVGLVALMPKWEKDGSWRKGKVEVSVELNSISKKFVFNCNVEDPGSLLIHGRQRLSLAEFGLTPPTRMMGMVRVNEWVELDFELRFGTDG